MNRKAAIFLTAVLIVIALTQSTPAAEINLHFLDSLKTYINLPSGEKIYCWQRESRVEDLSRGLATVEDNALAAMAYLKNYEINGDKKSLDSAKTALEFVMTMQNDDASFYSFIMPDGEKKERVEISLTSGYALWALGWGSRVIKKADPVFESKLAVAFQKVLGKVELILDHPAEGYGHYILIEGRKTPAWLIGKRGDISALYLLGILEYYQAHRDSKIYDTIGKIAEGILNFKDANPRAFYPHLPLADNKAPGIWSVENSFQFKAIAEASTLLGKNEWLKEGEKGILDLYPHLLASYGPIYGNAPHPEIFPQKSSTTAAMVLNCTAFFKTTGKDYYSTLAGVAGSWYFGNNPVKLPVYTPSDGKCFERIDFKGRWEKSTAESTAWALLALFELKGSPGEELLPYTEAAPPQTYQVLEAEEGKPVYEDYKIEDVIYPGGSMGRIISLFRLNSFYIKFQLKEQAEYLFYLVFQKYPLYDLSVAINMRVDGHEILLIPMAGAEGEPYMTIEKAIGPMELYPGLHTLGVRFKSMLFSKPGVLDCIIIQPVVEMRILNNISGNYLVLLKNMGDVPKTWTFPQGLMPDRNVKFGSYSVDGEGTTGEIKPEQFKTEEIKIPIQPRGFSIIRW